MQPLLTAKNALLEEDTYNWWLVRTGLWVGLGGGGVEAPDGHTLSPWRALGPCQALGEIRILVIHSFSIYALRIHSM